MLDTLKAAKALKQAGFDDTQAEAVVATVGDAIGEHVTKADLEPLATKVGLADLRSDLAELRSETKTDIAGLRADLYRALWLQAAGIIGLTVAILRRREASLATAREQKKGSGICRDIVGYSGMPPPVLVTT